MTIRTTKEQEIKHNFIAGEWRPGLEYMQNINPSDTDDVIARYAIASGNDVQDAVSAAVTAVPVWSSSTSGERFEILDAIGSEIIQRKDELGDLLAREEGKTLKEAVAEAHRAGSLFKFFAAEVYRSESEGYRSLREGISLEVRREPIGVVAAITPWNFPLAIPAWKIAPALAYGNAVVFKPSELVCGSAWALAEIISRAGLPDGAFNLLMGQGTETGAALVEHPNVAGVSFTGSSTVGRKIGTSVFARGGKMQLEMGGKNPLIVLDDADLESAVEFAINGAFFSAGQRCTASSRLIVTKDIHDSFVDAMSKRMELLRIGDARNPNTDIGPVVSEAQLKKNLEYLRIGAKDGAKRLIGGNQVEQTTPGWYLSPALFINAKSEMQICREEIFGPIAAVISVGDYDEALFVANDSEFGLSAGIVSNDRGIIDHFINNIQAGMVQINLPTAGMDFHAPITGRKNSSFGPPEKSSHCREFFTNTKVVHANYGKRLNLKKEGS
jgi:aldehyde dehydrogenase (NAD+)